MNLEEELKFIQTLKSRQLFNSTSHSALQQSIRLYAEDLAVNEDGYVDQDEYDSHSYIMVNFKESDGAGLYTDVEDEELLDKLRIKSNGVSEEDGWFQYKVRRLSDLRWRWL